MVLAIAAMAVVALLRAARPERAGPPEGKSPVTPSLIVRTSAPLLLWMPVVVSLYVLVRGHNDPGGGFIGGLLAAGGVLFYAIARGTDEARRTLRLPPIAWCALGVLLAAASGLPSLLDPAMPFLTHLWWFRIRLQAAARHRAGPSTSGCTDRHRHGQRFLPRPRRGDRLMDAAFVVMVGGALVTASVYMFLARDLARAPRRVRPAGDGREPRHPRGRRVGSMAPPLVAPGARALAAGAANPLPQALILTRDRHRLRG